MKNSNEMNKNIEQEMNKVTQDDYLRPSMSFTDFTGEFSTILSQATEDKHLLVGSGMDFDIVLKGYVYLELLMKEHGARVNAEADESQESKEFKEQMPGAISDKKCLMAASRFITTRSGKSGDAKVCDLVSKGRGDVDTLADNITLVGFMRKNKDLVSQVKPGGVVINEEYLNKVEANALNLIKLRSAVITARDNVNVQLERQNKFLTLCIRVQREIKLFAEMAFYKDTERYNKFYASAVKRKKNKDTKASSQAREQSQAQSR